MEKTVVQRSYDAFAVCIQAKEGKERRVVPASDTNEGDLCIEMRIRLHSDGLMSNLLSQLIKVRARRRMRDFEGNVLGGGGVLRQQRINADARKGRHFGRRPYCLW